MFRTKQATPGVKRIPVKQHISRDLTSQTLGMQSTGHTPDMTPASNNLLKLAKFKTPAKQNVSIFDTTTIDQMPSVKARPTRGISQTADKKTTE